MSYKPDCAKTQLFYMHITVEPPPPLPPKKKEKENKPFFDYQVLAQVSMPLSLLLLLATCMRCKIDYRKRGNIGGTFKFGDLAIEHKIAKLKTANILAYVHNIIETRYATAKLKLCQYFYLVGFDEIAKFSAHLYF